MTIEVLRAGVDDYGHAVKMLVVGDPGAGKTRSASCWPNPLILSAEAGLMSVADRQTPNVKITSSTQVVEVIGLLQQGKAIYEKALGIPVSTIVVDTVDEIARLLVRERLASERKEAMAIQDWGWLGEQLRQMIRAFRNLDMHVIFNVHAKSQEDAETGRTFVKPGIQGAMGDEIAGYVDIAVLLQARPMMKVVNGQNVRVISRFMQTYPDSMHSWIKDRSGKLPQEFPINFDDDFERLDQLLFGAARAAGVSDVQAIKASLQAESAPTPEPSAPAPEPEVLVADTPAEPAPAKKAPAKKVAAKKVEPEPEPEPVAEDEPEVEVESAPEPTPEPTPEPEPVPEPETPVEVASQRHPEGTYDDSPDAVAADCPKGYGCMIDKDMGDLSYIRFRKRLCRACFVDAKKK